ncbi:preprotein translocase subunit SecE [Hippea jasoniae]|uniref:preprotein translocase subunit SecE n=1 Tax=Hippea jasoniae TaxID=944479 RepID=UPI000A5F1229|nr:preprotein translocase subunit SecE [Hippea jasoniae]
MIKKVLGFLEEVKIEFKKVVWPGKKEVSTATISVVLFTVIVAFILSVLDYLLSIGLQSLFK